MGERETILSPDPQNKTGELHKVNVPYKLTKWGVAYLSGGVA
jgi:hypothetical protein